MKPHRAPRLAVHPQNPQGRHIDRAVEALKQGGIIVYPTDTVYGLGCDITQRAAVDRVIRIKARDPKKPMSFVCADLTHISQYANVSDFAYKILRRYLPGPYTFVLPASRDTPKILQSKQRTVGIRIPDHPVPLALVAELGEPLLSTSANRSSEETVADPEDLEARFAHDVDLILECGPLPVLPSSVISLVDDRVEILREGAGDVTPFRGEGGI
jgi:tRNA threonylcarbamoyl adenosine modification protein (Sua5/YciO/YrdC/YwlC family)